MNRLFQHLLHIPLLAQRAFPASTREAIRQAVADGEARHRGEIRFVVEGSWPPGQVWSGKTPQQRAIELFGLTQVWDTEENTGVLVYALLCERHVQVLADRGINARVPAATWDVLCQQLLKDYAAGDFEGGTVKAITALSDILAQHFPATGSRANQLPDEPVVLG
jgi:uncharacterized membrane protein